MCSSLLLSVMGKGYYRVCSGAIQCLRMTWGICILVKISSCIFQHLLSLKTGSGDLIWDVSPKSQGGTEIWPFPMGLGHARLVLPNPLKGNQTKKKSWKGKRHEKKNKETK